MEFKGKLSEAVVKPRGIRICWDCESVWEDDCLIGTHVECPNGCGGMERYPSVEYAIQQTEGRIEYEEAMGNDVMATGAKERLHQLKEIAAQCE